MNGLGTSAVLGRAGTNRILVTRTVVVGVAVVATAVAAACAGTAAERVPRDLAWEVDVCEYCHMSVDDPLRAAQWIPQEGPILTFDEPGCLIAWLQRNPGAVGRAYVADGQSGEWVSARDAVYVVGGVRTGMGFDVVSYAREGGAKETGELLHWDELMARGVRDAHAH